MNRPNLKRILRLLLDLVMIALGTLVTAIALNALLVPNDFPSGGVSTIGMMLMRFTGLSLSLSNMIFNVPLFLINVYLFGFRSGTKTLWGILTLSLWLELTLVIPTLTDNLMLACIYGGVLSGLGMGLVFRFGGTTGGTDLAANIAHHFTGTPIGTSLAVIDLLIMGAALYVFGPEPTMYGMITIFVTGRIIDLITEGTDNTRTVLVISDKCEEVGEAIDRELERGVTFLRGAGYYRRVEQNVVLSAIKREQLSDMKKLIHAVDADAFVIILDAHEILGEGFKKRERG